MLSSSENTASTNEMQSYQAFQVGTGGLEYAKYLLDLGVSPVVIDKALGTGTYTITTDPPNSLVTVDSRVGVARKVQSINGNFAKNCVALDTSGAYTQGYDLNGVLLTKTCNQISLITKMVLDWNWSPCVINSTNPLLECPNVHETDHDHGGAEVTHINLNGTALYNPGNGIGTPIGGADANEEIDVADYAMGPNGDYVFQGPPHPIRFSKQHPGGGLYTITVEFSDGSQIQQTFQDPTTASEIAPPLALETENGKIQIGGDQNVKIEVLCSEISYGRYGIGLPVTVDLVTIDDHGSSVNKSSSPLFSGSPVKAGAVHEMSSGKGYEYAINGKVLYGGRTIYEYDSTNTLQVKTLMNGEEAPRMAGYGSQKSVSDCLAPYLDNAGQVKLEANQAILLFELGIHLKWNPHLSAADFQDLVVLFTITPPSEKGTGNDDGENDECSDPEKFLICHVPPGNSQAAHTLCVNHHGWENGHNGGHGIHRHDYLGACLSSIPPCTSP